jgi:hypothetical protein
MLIDRNSNQFGQDDSRVCLLTHKCTDGFLLLLKCFRSGFADFNIGATFSPYASPSAC